MKRKKSKDDGVNKGTLGKIVECALRDGATPLGELRRKLHGVSRQSVNKALSTFRSRPGILEVPAASSSPKSDMVVTIAEPFRKAATELVERDAGCIDALVKVLLECDGKIRAKFTSTGNPCQNGNENGGLDTIERPKTGPDEGNLLTSCIYNKDTLFNTVKENAKKKVKENQRQRNSTSKCDEKSTAKLG